MALCIEAEMLVFFIRAYMLDMGSMHGRMHMHDCTQVNSIKCSYLIRSLHSADTDE